MTAGSERRQAFEMPVTLAEGAHRAERALLYLLLENPGLLGRVEAELGPSPFSDPHHQQIYDAARPLLRGAEPFAGRLITCLLDRLSDPEVKSLLTEMAAKPVLTTDPEKEAADCIEKIRKHRDSRRLEDLENQIRAAGSSKQKVDPVIWNEYVALVRKYKLSRS